MFSLLVLTSLIPRMWIPSWLCSWEWFSEIQRFSSWTGQNILWSLRFGYLAINDPRKLGGDYARTSLLLLLIDIKWKRPTSQNITTMAAKKLDTHSHSLCQYLWWLLESLVIWSVLSSAEVTQTSRQASAAYAPRNCNFNYKPSLEFAFNIKIGNESIATARTFRTFFIVFVQWEIQINLIQSHWLNKKFQKSLMNSLKTKKNSIGTFLIVIMEVDIVHFFFFYVKWNVGRALEGDTAGELLGKNCPCGLLELVLYDYNQLEDSISMI